MVGAFERAKDGASEWLPDGKALNLLSDAKPDVNVPMSEKRQLVEAMLADWPALEAALRGRIETRAADLEESHKRVRQAVATEDPWPDRHAAVSAGFARPSRPAAGGLKMAFFPSVRIEGGLFGPDLLDAARRRETCPARGPANSASMAGAISLPSSQPPLPTHAPIGAPSGTGWNGCRRTISPPPRLGTLGSSPCSAYWATSCNSTGGRRRWTA